MATASPLAFHGIAFNETSWEVVTFSSHSESHSVLDSNPGPELSGLNPVTKFIRISDESDENEDHRICVTTPADEFISRKKRKRVEKEVSTSFLCKSSSCGSRKCLSQFKMDVLREIKLDYLTKCPKTTDKRQWLLDYLSENKLEESGSEDFYFRIRTRKVCQSAFLHVYGIAKSQFYRIRNLWLEGYRTAIHRSTGVERNCASKKSVVSYLRHYIGSNCDYMPHVSQRHLSPVLTLEDLYNRYLETADDDFTFQMVSKSYFLQIFRKYFPDVRIPKNHNFSKCDICAKLDSDIAKNPRSHEFLHQRLQKLKKLHLELQQEQRDAFAAVKNRCLNFPSSILCLITDGMDQFKTRAPCKKPEWHALSNKQKLQAHLTGALSIRRSLTAFIDILDYPHDSNLNLNVILQVLRQEGNSLPKEFHLQLDNTARENKNQIVMAFMALLVQWKLFDVVTVGFLMKGHTHSVIDQFFSCISRHLGRLPQGFTTFKEFCEEVEKSYSKELENEIRLKPKVKRIEEVFAIREWILPHINGGSLHFLADHHQFRFIRDENEICIMYWKQWAHDDWSEGCKVQVLSSEPRGSPDLIKPSYSNVKLDDLHRMVDTGKECGAFTPVEYEEWKNQLEIEENTKDFYERLPAIEYNDKFHKNDCLQYCAHSDKWLLDAILEAVHGPPPPQCEESPLHPALEKAQEQAEGRNLRQVMTGDQMKASRRKKKVIEMEDPETAAASLQEGQLLLVKPSLQYCIENSCDPIKHPWIGKSVGPVSEGKVEVVWLIGNLNGSWHLPRHKNIDRIPFGAIIIWGVRFFTKQNRLTTEMKKQIQSELAELGQQYNEQKEKKAGNSSGGESDEFSSSDEEPLLAKLGSRAV